jgi:trans-aconitate methyltransferase
MQRIPTRIWELYAGCPLGIRLFAWARTLICPFDKVLAQAPPQGRFVEIGCGTGICANLLALDQPNRIVAGYDLNPKVVAAAARTVRDRPNITFQAADVQDALVRQATDVVVAVDLFHHLSAEAQVTVVSQVSQLLKAGGLFLLKDVERRPRWRYFANYLHDAFVAHGNPRIHVLSREEYCRMLESAGFTVEVVLMPKAYLAHILYVCMR